MASFLVRRSRRIFLAVLALAALVSLNPFGHSAANADGPSGAGGNNLHDVYLYPHGLSGEVHVWLNTPKGAYVEIGTSQVPNGAPHYLGAYANDLAAVQFQWNPGTYKVFSFNNLEQNTQYWAQITYQNADGSWTTKANQSFKTKQRTVAVSWGNVDIIDDSDPTGCGEMRFLKQVKVGGVVKSSELTNFVNDGCSGNVVKSVASGQQYIVGEQSLIVHGGAEDDDTVNNPFVLESWGLGGFGDLGEHASKQVQLDPGPWNGQESYNNRPFTVEPNGDSVHVKMHGTISVWYA